MFTLPSRHTVWTFISGVFTTLILTGSQWFPSFWSLFSDKPFFQWLQERWPDMTIAVYLYLKLLVYVVALGILYAILKAIYRQKKDYGWLEVIADKDSDQIHSRIHVSNARIVKKELSIPEPYVDIGFDILNASVYTLTLTQEVEGKMDFCGNPLHFSPEVSVQGRPHSNLTLTHADRFYPILRQRLSPEVAHQMLQEKGGQLATGHIALWFTHQDRFDTTQKVRVAIGNLPSS